MEARRHWKLFLPVNPLPLTMIICTVSGYLLRYLLVGGMPDVVQAFGQQRPLASRNLQRIVNMYRDGHVVCIGYSRARQVTNGDTSPYLLS